MEKLRIMLCVAVVTIVAFVAPVTEAGLQTKIGELLGLDPPARSVEAMSLPAPETTHITFWGLTTAEVDSPDNNFVLRAGVQLDDIEILFESVYQGVHGDNQAYGVCVLMHLLGEPGALGAPYIGFHATLIDAEDGGFYGPILGTKYSVAKNADIVVEGWYRDFTGPQKAFAEQNDEYLALLGLRLRY